MKFNNPTTVAIIMKRDNKISLSQRIGTKTFNLLWAFAGGSIEPGESPEQAGIRELQEETGLLIDINRLKFVTFN